MMDEDEALLHEELVLLNYEAKSKKELLTNLSQILIKKGYAKDSYLDGILKREEIYPTALYTEGVNVAIPHTDAIYVNKPAILIATLKEPITFKEMANGINDVDVRLIFMLAIKDPKNQVITLSKLMSIFSNKDQLLDVYNSKSNKEVIDKVSKVLN